MSQSILKDIQFFLHPTELINSQHPDIISKAEELTTGASSPVEQACKIFYFIRDQISYEFRAKYTKNEYLASSILSTGRGFCTQKAILFGALARSLGIPTGLYFYDIVDHTLPAYIVKLLRTRKLFHHGIVALYLNGNWNQYDATLDLQLTTRNNYFPVEFKSDQDCLMPNKTKAGEKHIEYVADYGLQQNVTCEQIWGWLKEGYPHLVNVIINLVNDK